jgi:hypothetical protein
MNNIYRQLKNRELGHRGPGELGNRRLDHDEIEYLWVTAFEEKRKRERQRQKLAMRRAAFKNTGNQNSKMPVNMRYSFK